MTATLTRPSVFDKALPALPKAAAKPDAPEILRYVGEWLAILATDPQRGGEFDRELEGYAAVLRQAGAISAHLGSGFCLALWAYQNVGNPLVPVLVAQVDRRAALRGLRHCQWRGTVPTHAFDDWRHDEALRRVQLPHKWERGE